MHITCVHIRVLPGTEKAFIDATLANHAGARCEKGNIRFDFLQSPDDPARFQLIEVFTGEDAAKFHKTTPHYALWKETVAPMMEKPREGVFWQALAPLGEKDWK
jgi:autoinducer 2-degrading protein